MGVPKFYRWVSERYPCLSQVVQEHQIPEFDNMYLDMNGIIHPCSHPNDDDPHFRITEEQIFSNIFHYIEVLFQIIKPKKVFFMAVDGVAPRAKMNQQRGRRFRSAREAEDNIRKALAKGQVLPKEERFDSNCITPGTVFMARLQEQLQYFVNDKISNDPAWQGLRIYLSGQQTPGEGEHKIMEFIRTERARQDYDPNTRHCLYGLDADLMMLGLSSHEPHFSLLREEVRFGKTSKRIEKPEQITFHLLHLSLFREYVDWEFGVLKSTLPFDYDLERIIDDWIMMGFLVGNDFIPHLPYMHINHDALPILYRVYKEVMPYLGGYLHNGGELSLERFEKYLLELSKFDRDKFGETFVDMKWFEAKVKHKFGEKQKPKTAQLKPKIPTSKGLSTSNMFSGLDALAAEFEQFKVDSSDGNDALNPELAALAAKMEDNNDEEEEVDEFEIEFAMHKKSYYSEKFDLQHVDDAVVANIAWEYVRGIQWILHYYFNGVQSWSWYYPFHYAPFLSDIKDFSHYKLPFDMGTPFLPFEQLLAVLPAASKQLLPCPLQNLMIMEESPIIDYYPLNFKTDLNGKQQEWEAVVLIPFIDENRLLEAMHPLYRLLTKDEKHRNRHGPFHLYTYDKDLADPYPSSLPGVFPDISRCHAKCETYDRDELITAPEELKKGVLEGVRLEVYFPGFPTLYHLPHTAELKKASVKVFQMHSRSDSMILKIKEQEEQVTIRVAEKLLGETCYVGWPHMVEALVTGLSDNTFRYFHKRDTKEIEQEVVTDEFGWEKQAKSFTQTQMERRGIEVGRIEVLVEACPVVGRRFLCSAKGQVTLEKEWSPVPKAYALQTIVKDIHVHDSIGESSVQTIEQLFPVDSICFMLAMPHYGCCGKVLEVDTKQGRVRVQLKVPEEPDLTPVVKKRDDLSVGYLPSHIVAQKMGISPSLLGKITAKYLIEQGSREKSKGQGSKKFDIGLNMKLTKQNKELLGYTRRTEHGWMFSQAARNVINQYFRKFPKLFEGLASLQQVDQCYESDLKDQGIDPSVLPEVEQWLKTLPIYKQRTVTCGSDVLDDPILEAIEEAVQKTKDSQSPKAVKVRVRPYILFRPSDYLGNILPDSDAEFQLFDRVINVKLNSAVPFGLRGTIVGFHIGEDEEELIEVMFDEHFIGAQSIRRSTNGVYLAHPSSLIDITYGERQEMRKRGILTTPPRPLKKTFATALSANGSPRRDSPKNGSPRPHRHGRSDKGDSPGVLHILTNGPTPERHSSPQTSRLTDTPYKVGQTASPAGRTPARTPNAPVRTPTSQGRTPPSRGRNRKDIPPRFAKNADNSSEFASMWKELQLKETSPPDKGHSIPTTPSSTPKQRIDVETKHKEEQSTIIPEKESDKSADKLAEDSTKVLCDLLQIGKKTPTGREDAAGTKAVPPQPATPQQPSSIRALSLDELFSSSKSPAKTSPVPPSPSQESAPPSQALANWCASVGLPPPTFHYTKTDKGYAALVELANGFKCPGTPCKDRSEAAHSAAAVTLSQMRRMMPVQFPPPGHSPTHPLIGGPFPPHMPPVPRMRGVPPPMFGYPISPMGTVPHFPHATPHPMAIRPQDLRPRNATPRPTQHRHGAEREDRDKGQGKSKSLDPASNPFVPLQVTRRNVTPKKAERDTVVAQENTESNATEESPPRKSITEMLVEASKRSSIEQEQPVKQDLGYTGAETTETKSPVENAPLGDSAEAKAHGFLETSDGLKQTIEQGGSATNMTTTETSSTTTSSRESIQSSSTKDASKPARKSQTAGRAKKPLMAPSFFQRKPT